MKNFLKALSKPVGLVLLFGMLMILFVFYIVPGVASSFRALDAINHLEPVPGILSE